MYYCDSIRFRQDVYLSHLHRQSAIYIHLMTYHIPLISSIKLDKNILTYSILCLFIVYISLYLSARENVFNF